MRGVEIAVGPIFEPFVSVNDPPHILGAPKFHQMVHVGMQHQMAWLPMKNREISDSQTDNDVYASTQLLPISHILNMIDLNPCLPLVDIVT